VERQVQWLMEMEERLRGGVSLDDCHSVRAMLDELEVSCCYCIIQGGPKKPGLFSDLITL